MHILCDCAVHKASYNNFELQKILSHGTAACTSVFITWK